VVSLGLDTHKGDPCAIRRAGFELEGNDYSDMGELIGRSLAATTMHANGSRNSTGEVEAETTASSEAGSSTPDTPSSRIPLIVVQEGGYKMDKVPSAAADFLFGLLVEPSS
jgi:acetoin utilization deacetylase AcuC-like enzyme